MKYVKASEFKTEFAKVVDAMAVGGDALIVVKNGKPGVALAHVRSARKHAFFGMDKGKIRILGDIVSPMPELWD
jgi:antitoxin (DNA-binding transcriptional repressor) of toxin-antitoxin stability system